MLLYICAHVLFLPGFAAVLTEIVQCFIALNDNIRYVAQVQI